MSLAREDAEGEEDDKRVEEILRDNGSDEALIWAHEVRSEL